MERDREEGGSTMGILEKEMACSSVLVSQSDATRCAIASEGSKRAF